MENNSLKSDTPETDAFIREHQGRIGMTPSAFAARLTIKCMELERQRDHWRDEHDRVAAENITLRNQLQAAEVVIFS